MSLHTLAAPAEFVLEVKKSRFLVNAAPIDAPEDAARFLPSVADPAATHNCWAWRLGTQYRFSDDGEPASTAGKPILAAIDGQGYDRVMVVVTRWFGGIKLGAGGLVRAYGGAAAECLRRAERRELVERVEAHITLDFALEAALRGLLPQFEASVIAQDYDADGLHLTLSLPTARVEPLRQRLTDLSRGQARLDSP